MEYTTLGRTGLTVSRLALGCMSYGDPSWRSWVLRDEESQPFFQRAIEAGINFFDTSDMYSVGVSEEVTGRALRRYGNLDELVIATKVHFPLGTGPNMKGLGRKHIVQGCEASLRRLGVETIDLYQIHRLDRSVPMEEMLEALDHLVRSGKVRYLGASTMFGWEFAKALYTSNAHGWARFVSMQNHYNLLYREEEREMMPLCISEGVGVIPWSPLARGLLAGRPRAQAGGATARASFDASSVDYLYDHATDDAVIAAVRGVADQRGLPMARIALAWLLQKPGVTAPIVGATKLSQLDDAIAAIDVKLTAEECAAMEAPYLAHEVRGWV
ncbi:MAG: aldo/keto reductase [Gemmatimonadaceae bacterium]|nr:aldo/keto reductase [Gemmatimonadaceae bacterium]